MCCSTHCFADRAAIHYHTQAWQSLIHRKECFILLLKLKVSNIDIRVLHLDKTVVTNTFHGAVANDDEVSGCSKVTLRLLVSYADNLCKQFVPSSGPTDIQPDLDTSCLTL